MVSRLVCSNVLAIRCIGDYVFAGIGYTLHIFERRSTLLQQKVEALCPCNIHGIVNGPNNLLAVYGANRIRVYVISVVSSQVQLNELCGVLCLTDWIMAAEWLFVDNSLKLIVLLAHNIVEMYDATDLSDERKLRISCSERCILYGGCISATGQSKSEDAVIFGGTVFREILIWQPPSRGIQNYAPVLHRLTGHNGVIFSVAYDPLNQVISSTSDDRTIRLWKVRNQDEDGNVSEQNDIRWKTADISLMKSMFGHTARVWRSIIRDGTVITIGEDSLICTWSFTGRLLRKVYGHHGAAVWSIELADHILFTGGADGEIQAQPLELPERIVDTISLSVEASRAPPKYVSCLNSGILMTYHEDGTLSFYDRDGNLRDESLYLSRCSHYCVTRTSPCRSYVSFASDDGYVAVYKEELASHTVLKEVFEGKVMEGRILSLHWLGSSGMAVCETGGVVGVFNFAIKEGLCARLLLQLPHSREQWLTAATIYEKDLFVCADRAGNLHVYQYSSWDARSSGLKPKDQARPQGSAKLPTQTLAKVHGTIGVQAFAVLNGKLISAGRDGLLRFYEQRELQTGEWSVCELRKEKMPMDWIGNIMQIGRDTLVLGFKEAEFLVYGMSARRLLLRVPCGGGHRSWDFAKFADTVYFSYIRGKRIFAHNCQLQFLTGPTTLLNGFHAKEIYCVKSLGTVLVSGGGDTTVRISHVSRPPPSRFYTFRTLYTLDGHLSSVKALASVELGGTPRKHLLFSVGGRAQIKAWLIETGEGERGQLNRRDTSYIDTATHFLYGPDQRRKKRRDIARFCERQPETRYMDVDVLCPDESTHAIIFVGCADGKLRIFSYDLERKTIFLSAIIAHADRCILRVRVLPLSNKVLLLTTSTDGFVRFFNFTDVMLCDVSKNARSANFEEPVEMKAVPIAELNLHRSGISSLDLKILARGECLLATGGDDNLFGIARLRINDSSIVLRAIWKTTSAHSAHITGIQFDDQQNKVYSVGIDQRMTTYGYECYQDGTLSVRILGQRHTAIADAQGLTLLAPTETIDEPLICVYGKGFELFALR